MHRHFGFFILLCAQYDRMLDRQVRSLIEYEYKHRKVSNMGWRGWFTSLMMLAPGKLFVKVRVWYPMHEKVGAEFYRCAKKYYSIYDTFALLDTEDTVQWDGASQGVPDKNNTRIVPVMQKEIATTNKDTTKVKAEKNQVTIMPKNGRSVNA